MSDVKLGTTPEFNGRVYIHVAVISVVAGQMLHPGDRVHIVGKDAMRTDGDPVGIVDPYLTGVVSKGDKFWLCLMPNTVTGMSHRWRHPAFPIVEEDELGREQARGKADSEAWLRSYAEEMNSYNGPEEAFRNMIDGLKRGELFANGTDLHGFHDVDYPEGLRRHAENYLGITIDWDDFTFSCSC
jgi:hypothetical protein